MSEYATDNAEALAEALRREFWRPDNGGNWERIAAALLASDWMRQHDDAVQAEALGQAADALIALVPYNFELRPDGTEDPIRAAYVEGHRDVWSALEARAARLRAGGGES